MQKPKPPKQEWGPWEQQDSSGCCLTCFPGSTAPSWVESWAPQTLQLQVSFEISSSQTESCTTVLLELTDCIIMYFRKSNKYNWNWSPKLEMEGKIKPIWVCVVRLLGLFSFLWCRKILELGSGLGLTGLVICQHCEPQRFIFSDCHPNVMTLLSENIHRNVGCDTSQANVVTHATHSPSAADKMLTNSSLDSTELSRSQSLDFGADKRFPISLGHSWHIENSDPHGDSQGTVTRYRHTQKDGLVLMDLDWEAVSDKELVALAREVDLIIAAGMKLASGNLLKAF